MDTSKISNYYQTWGKRSVPIFRILGSILQSILLIIFARTTEITNVGIVTTIMSIMSILINISDFGSRTLGPIEYRKGNLATTRNILNLNWVVSGCLALLGSIVIVIFNLWKNVPASAIYIVLWFTLEKCVESIMALTSSNAEFSILGKSILIRRVSPLFIYLIFISMGTDSLASYGLALLIGAFFSLTHSISWLKAKRLLEKPCLDNLKLGIHESRHVSQLVVLNQITNLDVPLVGLISGMVQAGFFSAVVKLANPFYLITESALSSFRPNIAVASLNEKKLWVLRFFRIFLGMNLIALPCILFSHEIIYLVLGSKYQSASIYLILTFIFLPSILSNLNLQSFLIGIGEHQYLTRIAKLAFFLSISLTLLLAIILGGPGVYVGLYSSFVLKNLLSFRKLMKIVVRD